MRNTVRVIVALSAVVRLRRDPNLRRPYVPGCFQVDVTETIIEAARTIGIASSP